MLPVTEIASEEKQRIAEKAQSSTRLSATMTPFALSRLMPLPFWPVPPESARMLETRLPRDDRAVLALRVARDENAGVAAILDDVAARPACRATGRARGRSCRSIAKRAVFDAAGASAEPCAGAAASDEGRNRRGRDRRRPRHRAGRLRAAERERRRRRASVPRAAASRRGAPGRAPSRRERRTRDCPGMPMMWAGVRKRDLADLVAPGRQEERSAFGLGLLRERARRPRSGRRASRGSGLRASRRCAAIERAAQALRQGAAGKRASAERRAAKADAMALRRLSSRFTCRSHGLLCPIRHSLAKCLLARQARISYNGIGFLAV